MSKSILQMCVQSRFGEAVTTLEAPEGFEFTGEYRLPKKDEYFFEVRSPSPLVHFAQKAEVNYRCAEAFILRPLSTPKERRAKALERLWDDQVGPDSFYTKGRFCQKIEAIFDENPDEVSK